MVGGGFGFFLYWPYVLLIIAILVVGPIAEAIILSILFWKKKIDTVSRLLIYGYIWLSVFLNFAFFLNKIGSDMIWIASGNMLIFFSLPYIFAARFSKKELLSYSLYLGITILILLTFFLSLQFDLLPQVKL